MPTTVPTDALTTRQKVKDAAGISDTSKDTLIDELITGVTAFIKSYCGGRNFLSQSYTEIHDTFRGRTKLFMRQLPVSVVASVSQRTGPTGTPTWLALDVNSYMVYTGNVGYIQFFGKLVDWLQGIQIAYTAGYLIDWANEFTTTHTLPEDLTMVATELVVKYMNTIAVAGILTEQTEGQSVTFSYKARELDDDHKNILAAYKIQHIAR